MASRAVTHRPLGGYAALMTVFGLGSGSMALAAHLKRHPAPLPAGAQLALLGVATFRLSRLVAKDAVTSALRSPFVAIEGEDEAPSELVERPRGQGLRRAVGELIHCPYCIGTWIAAAFVGGSVLAPQATRAVATVLAVDAIGEACSTAYAWSWQRINQG